MPSPPSSPLVSLPDGLTPNDLLDALRKVVAAQASRNHQLVQTPQMHNCSAACTFIEHMSIYVCVHSGNYHVCSMASCKNTTLYEEEYVCDITGNCYPLDAIIPSLYDNARAVKPAPVRTDAQANGSTNQKPTKRPRIAKASRLGAPGVADKHRSEAINVLDQVLRPLQDGDKPVTECCDMTDLLSSCKRLWSQCVKTNIYKLQPLRYRHRYHVLVVLYASIKGLKVNSTTIVQQQDVIKRCLPPFKTLPRRIKDLDQSTFTKTNKIFLACMRELYTSKES
jgi:hypothetical protein